MVEKKTYCIVVICDNCGHVTKEDFEGETQVANVHIPRGTSVETFLQHRDCSYCGCRGFLKRR